VSAAIPIPSDSRPKLSSRARTQTDKVTGKPLVVYPEGVLVLNPTGEKILALCDGNRTFQQIVAELAARFNAPEEVIAREAATFLQRLRERNLLSSDGEAKPGDTL